MSQCMSVLKTLPSRGGTKRSTKVESHDDGRAFSQRVAGSRRRRQGVARFKRTSHRHTNPDEVRAIRIRTCLGYTNPLNQNYGSSQRQGPKGRVASMTTRRRLAKRGGNHKGKYRINCLAKILWTRMAMTHSRSKISEVRWTQ